MQLDQLGDRLDLVIAEAQGLHPFAGDLGADHIVVVEGDRPALHEPAGARLADVVHQGRETGDEVGLTEALVLLVNGLLQDSQAVLVDILVTMVFVALQSQGRQLRQYVLGQSGVDQQSQATARVGRHHQLDQLISHPLGRDDGDAFGHVSHRLDHLGGDRKSQLRGKAGGTHHPQGVIGEGVLGAARRTQLAMRQIEDAAMGVDQSAVGQGQRHRVDGEVTPTEIAINRVAIGNFGFATVGVI